jgi:hypothetical protein
VTTHRFRKTQTVARQPWSLIMAANLGKTSWMVLDVRQIEALVVCGASGTGKTVTSWEIGRVLQGWGIPHALIDTDELDRVWPQPEPVEALISVSRHNLQAIWKTFSDLGVRRLVLSGVMASIPQSESWLKMAIVGAEIKFVRLIADRETRERRLRGREVGGGFEGEMRASDRATEIIRKLDRSETPVVVTDGKEVSVVAGEVLRAVGWF